MKGRDSGARSAAAAAAAAAAASLPEPGSLKGRGQSQQGAMSLGGFWTEGMGQLLCSDSGGKQ